MLLDELISRVVRINELIYIEISHSNHHLFCLYLQSTTNYTARSCAITKTKARGMLLNILPIGFIVTGKMPVDQMPGTIVHWSIHVSL